ncbi:hypothetical protein TR80_015340 [Xanthomonas campestris]|nr:hypothetical protein TR80_015340 [Xanthomonas campestris]
MDAAALMHQAPSHSTVVEHACAQPAPLREYCGLCSRVAVATAAPQLEVIYQYAIVHRRTMRISACTVAKCDKTSRVRTGTL